MSQANGVMMQYFHWYTDPNLILWNEVKDKAQEFGYHRHTKDLQVVMM